MSDEGDNAPPTIVPAEPGGEDRLPPLAERPREGSPEQLGFNLRFEAGRALIALDGCTLVPGLTIVRALFEVPDVAFPLDVTGGAIRFQDKRLTLRAAEFDIDTTHFLDAEALSRSGFTVRKLRARGGALEILFDVDGPSRSVGMRARVHLTPAGNAGVALLVDDVISFGPSPRERIQVAESLLGALLIPGAFPPRGMIRRAEILRAVFARLLPSFGWKVPALGEVRVHDVTLQKTSLLVRAWSGDIPDGWKKPRAAKRSSIDAAVALAVFADGLADAASHDDKVAVVDRIRDRGVMSASLAPYAADILRADKRRRQEGQRMIDAMLDEGSTHLGLLSASVDDERATPEERVARLARLGEAADDQAEPWVAARAFHAAAVRAHEFGDDENAVIHARSAFLADPTLSETGRLLFGLLSKTGALEDAMKVGRQALDRIDDEDEIAAFSAELAPVAALLDGVERGRELFERALRRRDSSDALRGLISLEIDAGDRQRASELLARLLTLDDVTSSPERKKDAHVLAAHLARRKGDVDAARTHLLEAERAAPGATDVALAIASLEEDEGNAARALVAIDALADDADDALHVRFARLLLLRADDGDEVRARRHLDAVQPAMRDSEFIRVDATLRASAGDAAPLARLLERDASSLDGAARIEKIAEAAAMYHRAMAHGDAGRLLAQLSVTAPLADALLQLFFSDDAEPSTAEAFVHEADVGEAIPVSHLSTTVSALASRAPRSAAIVSTAIYDVDALRRGLELAEKARDPALELSLCRRVLDASVDGDFRGTVLVQAANLAFDLPGEGADAALAFLKAAHAAGVEVTELWLRAAIATSNPTEVARVLVETESVTDDVPTELLRRAVDDDVIVSSAVERRLSIVASLAARQDASGDAEKYLDLLSSTLPDDERARRMIQSGIDLANAGWILEGIRALSALGHHEEALRRTDVIAGTALARERRILEARFDVSLIVESFPDLVSAGDALLACIPADDSDARLEVHRRRAERLGPVAFEDAGPLFLAWLSEDAQASALEPFIDGACREGNIDAAIEALLMAQAENVSAARASLLASVLADAAHELNQLDDESVALEILAATVDGIDAQRAATNRWAAVLFEIGDDEGARAAWSRRATQGGSEAELADAWRHVARLSPDDDRAAADALLQVMALDPDDEEARRACLQRLESLGDWSTFADVLGQRVALMPNGAERTAALVRIGVVFEEKLDDSRAAARAWLSALRRPPKSDGALKRLREMADRQNSHTLRVRAELAAARSHHDDVEGERHALDAGALLAGILMRTRLAARVYEAVAKRSPDPRPSLRALVELFRSLGDGPAALDAATRFVDAAESDAERALAIEMQADVLDRLLDEHERAIERRRAALALAPGQRVSGLALAASLRAAGDVRGAIEVRRALADASEAPALRAQTYVYLADLAEEHLDDKSLMVELAQEAMAFEPGLMSLRLRVIENLESLNMLREMCDEIGRALDGDLGVDERVSLTKKRAHVEVTELQDYPAARATLERTLAEIPSSLPLKRVLVSVLAAQERPLDAAQVLESLLRDHDDEIPVFGSRRIVLEEAAMLHEDADDFVGAMSLLDEAAALGHLSRASELRRLRLAESLQRPGDAMRSAENLLADRAIDIDERVALEGRLGRAAEASGELLIAQAAWMRRVEIVKNDVNALLTLERLSLQTDSTDDARRATEALLRSDVGDAADRRRRLIFVAEDALHRTDEATRALLAIEEARAIEDDDSARTLALAAAEAAHDVAATIRIIDDEESATGGVSTSQRRTRALLLSTSDPERALTDIVIVLEASRSTSGAVDDDELLTALLASAERHPKSAAVHLLSKVQDGAAVEVIEALKAALRDPSALDDDQVMAVSDRWPTDDPFTREAVVRLKREGKTGAAVDRLLASAHDDGDGDVVRHEAASLAVASGGECLVARLNVLLPTLAVDEALREDALHTLRDVEAWTATVTLLEASLPHVTDDRARAMRLEMALVLRENLDDASGAVDVLRTLVDNDAHDREAWGEFLESLDEAGDERLLAEMLGRRLQTTSGVERRELTKRRARLLSNLGEAVTAIHEIRGARIDAPDDEAMRDLEQELARSLGGEATSEFLAREFERTLDVNDAWAVLRDEGARASIDVLTLAAETVLESRGAPLEVARCLVQSGASTGAGAAAGVYASIPDDAREAFAAAVLTSLRHSSAAARDAFVSQLVDSGNIESPSLWVAADHVATMRTQGARAAASRLQTLDVAIQDRTDLLSVVAAVAARAHDVTLLEKTNQVSPAVTSAELMTSLHAAALAALVDAASTGHALAAAARVGDAGAFFAHVPTVTSNAEVTKHGAAITRLLRATHQQPLTSARLAIRGQLFRNAPSAFGPDDARAVAKAAAAAMDPSLELAALCHIVDHHAGSVEDIERCATLALEVAHPDADAMVARAASRGAPERSVGHRRTLIQLAIQNQMSAADIGARIHVFVDVGGQDSQVTDEGVGFAEAAQLPDVADELLGNAYERASDPLHRESMLQRLVTHRLKKNDAASAFLLLKDAPGHRDEAYWLAVREGLTDAQLLVVDDDLAAAGLAAVLGDGKAYAAARARLEGPLGHRLDIEMARASNDADAEVHALRALGKSGAASPADRIRLATLDATVGNALESVATLLLILDDDAADEDARLTLAAILGRDPQVLGPVLDGVAARIGRLPRDDVSQRLLVELGRSVLTVNENVIDTLTEMLDAWPSDAIEEAHAIQVMRFLSAEDAGSKLVTRGARPGVVAAVVANPDGAAVVLSALEPGHASFVIDVLRAAGADASLSVPLRWLLANALESESRLEEATAVLTSIPDDDEAARLTRQLRLLGIDARRGLTAQAAARLLSVVKAGVPDHARAEILRLARTIGPASIPSVLVVASSWGTSSEHIELLHDLSVGMRPTLLPAVASFLLKARPRDIRSRQFAAAAVGHQSSFFVDQMAVFDGYGSVESTERVAVVSPPVSLAMAPFRTDVTLAVASPVLADTLDRARRGPKAFRQAAWAALAEAAAAEGRSIDAARLLSRAGMSLASAPIEIRLVADAALGDPTARGDAIVDALQDGSVTSERRAALLGFLVDLDDRGHLGARHRAVLDDDPAFGDLVERNDAAALRTCVSELGRRPRAKTRATLAAALVAVGETELARRLLPASVSSSPVDAATLIRTRLAKGPDARSALGLERLLIALDGTNDATEKRIGLLADAVSRYDIVDETLARRSALSSDPTKVSELHLARAQLAMERTAQRSLARVAARTAALSTEGDVDAAETWARAALFDENPKEAVTALARLEMLARDDDIRRTAALRRSALLRHRLSEPQAALDVVDAEMARGSKTRVLLEEAARSLRDLSRPVDAMDRLLEAIDARGTDEDARVRLAREVWQLATELNDDARALKAGLVLARRGTEGTASALESVARRVDDPASLVEVLTLLADAEPDVSKKRQLVSERARVIAERLDDRAGAMAALEAQAQADPSDFAARLQLAEWYLVARRILDAALAYESASHIEGVPPHARGPAAREAATLLSAVGDLERAGPLAIQAIALGVLDRRTLAVAAAYARERGDYQALDGHLAQELKLAEDPRDAAWLWLERAKVKREQLDDEHGAQHDVHRALELVPDHREAMNLMRANARLRDAWGPLRAALSRAAELTDDDNARVDHLVEMVRIDEEHLGDLRAALATLDRALLSAESNPRLLVQKAVLLAKLDQLDDLPAVLDAAERAGATDLPGALHVVRGDALFIAGDRAGAVTAFEAATRDPSTRDRAWDRLIDLAEGEGATTVLALRLELARAASDDKDRRAALARRAARIRLDQGDEDRAMSAYESVLADSPSDTEALRSLRDIYARRRKSERLVPLMEAWVAAVDDVSERARRATEFGLFLIDDLGSEAKGRAALEDALRLDGTERNALRRLAALASAASQHERALTLLDRVGPDEWVDGAVDLLFRRAHAAFALERDDVVERLDAVLAIAPQHVPTLELSVEVAKHHEDRARLLSGLRAMADTIDERTDPLRLAKTLSELADVTYDDGDAGAALAFATRSYELKPNSIGTLERIARSHTVLSNHMESAEAWRRVEQLVDDDDRPAISRHRAEALEAGGDLERALDVWMEVAALTGDEEAADRARSVEARLTPLSDETTKNRPAPREEMTVPGVNALTHQVDDRMTRGAPDEAIALLREAFATGSADADHAALGIDAARAASDAAALVFFIEERLKGASDQDEVKRLSIEAGRTLRDVLNEPERAADLMYLAHQAAPEEIDVRLELTALYAKIPRLIGHAQTGVLQLFRRVPGDPRVAEIGADVALRQRIPEKRAAMLAAADVTKGRAPPSSVVETPSATRSGAKRAVDMAALKARITPEGFGNDFDDVMRLLEPGLEMLYAVNSSALTRARRISDVSPTAIGLLDRVDRLLPGRPLKVLLGPEDETVIHAGATIHVVLPRDTFSFGDAVAVAHLARAVFVCRTGGVIAAVNDATVLDEAVAVSRAVAIGAPVGDGLAAKAAQVEKQVLANQIDVVRRRANDTGVMENPEIERWLDVRRRAADRFAMFASGSLVGALAAGPCARLLRLDAAEAAARVRTNARATDLIAYAARDNAWLLRRDLGLTDS